MTEGPAVAPAPPARRGTGSVAVTGAAAASAYGRGTEALMSGTLSGQPAFAPVQRFDVGARRVRVAAAMPGLPDLRTEVTRAAAEACGEADRVVVAGGYLVDSDQFALFDAGRVLAGDGQVRPFSAGRRGLLLGDGIGAVVVESLRAARARRAPPLARLAGWGRTGDAYHPCQPHPEGLGMARAVTAALQRAGIAAEDLGYINAHGSGTSQSDPAETNALRLALGAAAASVPVSSTKSLHGQTLEASGVLELIVTLLAARKGMLPVNAGFLGTDDRCRLNLVLGGALAATAEFAMSLNAAFGGANTALVIGLP